MANITNLETSLSTTDQAAYASGSISPAANQLILAAFWWAQTGVGTVSATGNGLTWVAVDSNAGGTRKMQLFRAMGSSPTPGAVTFTVTGGSGTPSRGAWSIIEVAQVDTTGTNGSVAQVQNGNNGSNSATTTTVNLAAFSNPNNITIGFLGADNGNTITPGSGFTQIAQANNGAEGFSIQSQVQYANDTTVDWTISPAADIRATAVEVKVIPQGGILAEFV